MAAKELDLGNGKRLFVLRTVTLKQGQGSRQADRVTKIGKEFPLDRPNNITHVRWPTQPEMNLLSQKWYDLSDSLLVQPCWIAEHAPGLSFWHCCSAPLPSLPPSRTCLQMSAERICPKSARSELFACARSYPSPFRAGRSGTALILRVEQCAMEEHNQTIRAG